MKHLLLILLLVVPVFSQNDIEYSVFNICDDWGVRDSKLVNDIKHYLEGPEVDDFDKWYLFSGYRFTNVADSAMLIAQVNLDDSVKVLFRYYDPIVNAESGTVTTIWTVYNKKNGKVTLKSQYYNGWKGGPWKPPIKDITKHQKDIATKKYHAVKSMVDDAIKNNKGKSWKDGSGKSITDKRKYAWKAYNGWESVTIDGKPLDFKIKPK